jgi:asparagine synthase (glutamine-hydrolysing)
MNSNLKGSFFSEPERFEKHFQSSEDLVLSYFNSTDIPNGSGSLNRAFYCDIKTYLPEDILAVTDRMSMHHALEVRVPFLDHKFMEFCATIPPEMKMKWFRKKYLLKKGVKNLLPKQVIEHRKQGFVGPMAQWLKNDLRPLVLETLSEKNLRRHELFDCKNVHEILDHHFSGKEIYDSLIWSMVIFQTWFDMYIEQKDS